LLFPIDWPEPFGLVMIEAMACGTPVIAYRSGSVPEVIDDGVTGFIVESEEEAVDAVNQLARLDRRKVRECFEERFSARRMARAYESHYRQLLDGPRIERLTPTLNAPARCDPLTKAEPGAAGRSSYGLGSERGAAPA
jgi:glycogen synthase